MRYAIFSDIHSHFSALKSVLDHAEKQSVDAYFCLGDVGTGQCIELVRSVETASVFGNWEAANWQILSPAHQRWALKLPPLIKRDRFWLTHAGLFWPPRLKTLADLSKNPYLVSSSKLFPYLHYEREILWKSIAALTDANVPLLFHGHSHRQYAWCFTRENKLQRLAEQTIPVHPDETLLVGVGSVGRPLDDPSAAYIIFDGSANVIELHRVT